MLTTAPLTRSTSGAPVPGSAPVPTAPGGGAAMAAAPAASTLAAINDDTAARIIGREGDRDLVAENHADAMLAQLAAEVGQDLVPVFQLDPEVSGWQHFDHAALELYVLLSTHRRREPYALWCSRSTMSTPPDRSANTEISDDAPGKAADVSTSRTPSTLPTRYIEDPHELAGGHAVRLLRNGVETFPAWLTGIASARVRISLEMYIFSDDTIGRQFADALIAAARRGVEVRLLYDFVGCRDTPGEFFDRMRSHGVHVIAYHRYRFWRPRFWALLRRNHRKTLVCDGCIAFAGGLNIANDWVSLADGGGDWHDAVLQVEGPAVANIEAIFLRTWNRRAKKWARVDPAGLPPPAPAGPTPLVVISNSELLDRFAIRRAALHALRESARRVLLANPYFVPDRGVLRALQRAAARGGDGRLLD